MEEKTDERPNQGESDPRRNDLTESHQGGVRKPGHKPNGGRDSKQEEDGSRRERHEDGDPQEEPSPREPKHGEQEPD